MITEYFAQTFDAISTKIAEHGICVMDNFVSIELVTELAQEIQALHNLANLHHAGTGAGVATVNKALRGDLITWLNEEQASLAQKLYFEKMELLRLNLNANLYLGLFALESHLTVYPAGSEYKKHIDRFKNRQVSDLKPVRQISCILYLNANWEDHFGGQLRIFASNQSEAFLDISPIGGRLVVFLSDTFYHAVLPATEDRMSIAGWFLAR